MKMGVITPKILLRFSSGRKPVGRYAPTGCSHLSAEPTE